MLATADGRERFWAQGAREVAPGLIEFSFRGGDRWQSRVLRLSPPERMALTYFGGSTAEFRLSDDGAGGTIVELEESGIPPDAFLDNHAGWVSVLLNLKAVAGWGVDLRNTDPDRQWAAGFVDV